MRDDLMSNLKVYAVLLAVMLAALLVLAGCQPPPPDSPIRRPVEPNYGIVYDDDIMEKTYHATEALLQRTIQPLDKSTPILVASLVNVDKLDESSSLGRILAEAISDRMAQLGYHISEVRLRGTMAVKKDVGQLMLTRDLRRLKSQFNAQAVVAGTYAVGKYKVHISLKLINVNNGRVISATTYGLALGSDTKALVGGVAML
jgi:TolB-like protein